MNDFLSDLVSTYKNAGIVVDTNLLLLFLMGTFAPNEITKFKRTHQFTQDDFELLKLFLEPFSQIITTPHILTEVNSLANQLANHLKPAFLQVFATYLTTLTEIQIPSVQIMQSPAFLLYGLTDTGIFLVARSKYLVLTDDLRLSVFVVSNGVDSVNFTHLRSHYLDI